MQQFFSIILFCVFSLHAQARCLVSTDQPQAVDSNNLSDIEKVVKSSLTSDISAFCENSLEQNLSHTLHLSGKTSQERAEELAESGHDAWEKSMYPSEAVRLSGLQRLDSLQQHGLKSLDNVEDVLAGKKALDSNLLPTSNSLARVSIEKFQKSHATISSEVGNVASDINLRSACLQLVWSPGCPNALKTAVSLVNPGSDSIAYPSLYIDVLTNRTYDRGLQLAALKIIARVKSKSATDAHLFEDIKDSFISAGASKTSANEMAWKTVALIATGGPNVSPRLDAIDSGPNSEMSKIALSTISSLSPVLDLITKKTGHPYSYPASVHTTCETGKSYHFWLTAYLSRDLVAHGYSPSNAAAAAFTAQKGYEMFSLTGGRDPTRPLTEDTFSPYSNTIRMDLAFSSAAALFGASSDGSVQNLDVDKGLKAIVDQSQMIPKMDRRSAENLFDSISEGGSTSIWSVSKWESLWNGGKFFYRWKDLMAPDAAFEAYQN